MLVLADTDPRVEVGRVVALGEILDRVDAHGLHLGAFASQEDDTEADGCGELDDGGQRRAAAAGLPGGDGGLGDARSLGEASLGELGAAPDATDDPGARGGLVL